MRLGRVACLGGADDRFLSSAIARKLAVSALCAAVLPLLASAQPTVIRTETRLVLVDTVVRDKKGKLAGDLGAADFRIWEDGKEQPIASFSRQAGASPEQPAREY
jgi:hypothetical protein